MIAKFVCADTETSIEFSSLSNCLLISVAEYNNELSNLNLALNKEELFELIGFLLRVQSEIKAK